MNAHSLGTCCWFGLKFPDWVVPALLDATGTRDPMSDSGHKYCDFGGRRIPFKRLPELAKAYYYGAEHTIGPDPALYGKIPDEEFFNLGYLDKEYAAKKQEIRGVIMGVGVFCDTLYPQTLAPGLEETGYHGDWEMEPKLLTAVTGVAYTEERLEQVAFKIRNMERAYSCLDIGRTRDYDMYIVHCHDARGGDWTRGIKIDARRFGQLLTAIMRSKAGTKTAFRPRRRCRPMAFRRSTRSSRPTGNNAKRSGRCVRAMKMFRRISPCAAQRNLSRDARILLLWTAGALQRSLFECERNR